ncbi:acyl-CoA synthetase short-chain family member 3, mitochondrial [Psammomys obesus]|uniref:acyl-CoA synthetase short-chain family member 3, mitochondrial n=1 Tax=Psammomys obesus TaxID=48139 RepID=UPI0024530D16|nr:acyl-CoA synthetase short-chain family member 3, mitochondrial [Psammomys obesus]
MKPSWLQCRKVTGAGTLGAPLPGSPSARGAGAARRALVASLGGRSCRALTTGSGGEYKTNFAASVADPERFWGKAAEQISWYKPWTKTLESRYPPSTSWFVEGMLNICYNAIDRHIENGQGDKIAIIYDSPVTNTKATITYKEVLEQVSKLAGVLVKQGVKKGDTVVIYMPMIPQAIYAMLACARIGAIHSLIFGGFASKELSTRIDHAKPKVVVTASFGIEPGRKVEYIPLLEEALKIGQHIPDRVLIYSRPNMEKVPLMSGRDLDWEEEMAKAQSHDCVPVLSEHPLYILYTSGTTGLPKVFAFFVICTMAETGSPITASCIGLGNSKTPPPGQAGKCVPGYNVMILDDNMQKLKARSLGNIVVKLPLPPGAFSGLWKNQEAFKHLYFEKFPGYYDTMDAGYMDEEGYVYVMSRVDDVINVAGHRISAGAIEESVLSHGTVADCAVVGKEDPLKGHVPLALCVLKKDINATEEQVLEEIVKHVRQSIGPVAAFRNAVFVKQLPKTRSGKIPRSTLSALVNGKPYKVTPTIEDPSIFGHIEEVLKQAL